MRGDTHPSEQPWWRQVLWGACASLKGSTFRESDLVGTEMEGLDLIDKLPWEEVARPLNGVLEPE